MNMGLDLNQKLSKRRWMRLLICKGIQSLWTPKGIATTREHRRLMEKPCRRKKIEMTMSLKKQTSIADGLLSTVPG